MSKWSFLLTFKFNFMCKSFLKKSWLALSMSIFTFIKVFAQQEVNTITTAVPFLMIAPDAQASGMGDVGAATTADANSIYWNPAKLAFIQKNMGLSLSYSPWLRTIAPDMNLAYISMYKKSGKQTFGVSGKFFSLGDMVYNDSAGSITREYHPFEYAFDLAYARKLSEHISGGVAFRYIYSNLAGSSAINGVTYKPGTSIAGDVSMYYHTSLTEKTSFAFGTNISNIGSKISYSDYSQADFIPTNLKLGTSIKETISKNHVIEIAFDANKLLVPTPPLYDSNGAIVSGMNPNVSVMQGMIQSFYDAPRGFKEELQEISYSVGIEYLAFHTLALRTGYFYENPYKGDRQFITLGAGVNYKFLTFDFSYYLPTNGYSPLDNTMKFSLACNIDRLFTKKEKSI